MIAIIDYGVGNLFSIKSALSCLSVNSKVTSAKQDILDADGIILPGVGAFEDAVKKLQATGLIDTIKQEARKGKPLLGICLGMQMLYERSFEYGEHEGLGLVKGDVMPIRDVVPSDFKIPHIGWEPLIFDTNDEFLTAINEGDYVYFVHSYYAPVTKDTIAHVDYGAPLTAMVKCGNILGTQFHPEKSGKVGLKLLSAFCNMKG